MTTPITRLMKHDWGDNVDQLLSEWDYKKNGAQKVYPMFAELDVTEKVPWWTCDAQGHSWQANISTRIDGRGCPFCAKR